MTSQSQSQSPSLSQCDAMFAMSSDHIEAMIGEALLADEFGSKGVSDAEKRSIARNWFTDNLDRFRDLLCGSHAVRDSVLGPGKKDRNALFGALIDVLDAHFGVTVPVAALAVMIVHWGIDKVCPDLAGGEG